MQPCLGELGFRGVPVRGEPVVLAGLRLQVVPEKGDAGPAGPQGRRRIRTILGVGDAKAGIRRWGALGGHDMEVRRQGGA